MIRQAPSDRITTLLLNPMDFIPDFMGFIGFTDDAIVLSVVFNSLRKDLIKYCSWKGYNAEEYFA
jgi:uncharacterized membrane protein YkvA (DUF1232 family)